MSYPRGSLILKEGARLTCSFIILTGQVLQYNNASIKGNASPTLISFSEPVGEYFGNSPGEELPFYGSYSAVCLCRTDLLKIDKQAWYKISQEAKMFESYQMDFLSSLKAFKGISRLNIMNIGTKWYFLVIICIMI